MAPKKYKSYGAKRDQRVIIVSFDKGRKLLG